MYFIDYTGEFKKQAKLMQKRGYNMDILNHVIKLLSAKSRKIYIRLKPT